MTITARAERRSAVVAVAATALLVLAMWLGALAVSNLPATRNPGDDSLPRGPVLSPQRWEVRPEAMVPRIRVTRPD